MFTSTSKITFPGAGVSALACSDNMMKYVCKRFEVMIISYDKMNQLRHVRFLKNKAGVLAHMLKHRRRKTTFAQQLTPCGNIAHWTNPKGGYFISLYVMPGCAKRVAQGGWSGVDGRRRFLPVRQGPRRFSSAHRTYLSQPERGGAGLGAADHLHPAGHG